MQQKSKHTKTRRRKQNIDVKLLSKKWKKRIAFDRTQEYFLQQN